MKQDLFQDFNSVSSKQWKQKIQYELKGADYQETLVWESLEGIHVRPFYHHDEDAVPNTVTTEASQFRILQDIYVYDINKSITRTKDVINRGAEAIRFIIDRPDIDIQNLLTISELKNVPVFITINFIDDVFIKKTITTASSLSLNLRLQLDPIGHLIKEGNFYFDAKQDFDSISEFISTEYFPITVTLSNFQNAGANMVQQLAYTLGAIQEYLTKFPSYQGEIFILNSVGGNYFFEIAKTRAIKLLAETLSKEYSDSIRIKILTVPSKRNKTLYDYNVNMLRTTTECMSAIIGGSDFVGNLAYDAIYHKDNEFGNRIARNQLLILKKESYFDKVDNPADGTYYIENLTNQLAEKALLLFKEIEASGGLFHQLIEGTIQRKIQECAAKEQELFDSKKEVLLGSNKYPNPQDKMKDELEIYPFIKQQPRKTLIAPIIEKRLAEKYELERLATEEEK